MDVEGALADLAEISSQIDDAVVFEEDGSVLASTCTSEEAARRLAATALELLAAAAGLRPHDDRKVTQLEVALKEGSVFVARDERRAVAATAAPGSPAGLVLYDLRTCLRSIGDAQADADAPPRRQTAHRRTPADA